MAVTDLERALKRGRPAAADALARVEEILRGEPERMERIARGQMELLARRVADGKLVPEQWLTFVRGRDPALAAEWERAQADRSVARSAADRVAAHVARRNEIGPLPEVVDPERRAAAEGSLLAFGLAYGMDPDVGFLVKPPSARMQDYVAALQRSIEGTGFIHIRLPRGKGKTSWMKLAILWAVVTGRRKFPVCFGATQGLANAIREDIWEFCERALAFGEDFPEVCHPIRCLAGKMQRADGQTLDGERTRIKRAEDLIVFPTVAGSAASGALLVVRGVKAGCRGLVRGSQRPDYLGLDDIQTKEAAKSREQIKDLEEFIQADALGLAGHDRQMAGVMPSTPIAPNDLSERYADRSLHPEWETISFPLVISWPKRGDLWDQYQDVYNRCRWTKDNTFAEATAFYVAHRAEMDEGAELLDDSDGDEHEVSALQHAMNLLFKHGKKAFMSEYQLAPPRQSEVFRVTQHMVASRVNRSPRLHLPGPCPALVVFCDVNKVAGLRWSAVACGPGGVAASVAYGRYPERGPLVPEGVTAGAEDNAVAIGLARVTQLMQELPFMRGGGVRAKPSVLCLDGGWKTKVVARFCAAVRAPFAVIWSKGFDASHYRPYTVSGETRPSVVARPGDHVHISRSENGEFLAIQTDYWRETMLRAWLAEPLQRGSLSLYGDDPVAHLDYAQSVASEFLQDKGVGQNGNEFWMWQKTPGTENHDADTLTGALAVASWYGYYDAAAESPLAAAGEAERRAALARGRPRRKAKVEIAI